MRKIYKSQEGFGLIEALLLIIAVALVAFVGYYVWHTQKQTDKTLSTAATASTTASNAISQPAKPKHTANEAVSFAQTTYDSYKKASTNPATGEPTGTSASLEAIKAALTPTFYGSVKAKYALPTEVNGKMNPNRPDYDLITCEQNTLSNPVASLKASNPSTASVNISDNTVNFTVTVDLNSLLISNVTCPGA